MRTAQILEQSGLMDVTLRTAALMRENALLQRDIDRLTAETRAIEQQFMATTRTSQPPGVYQNFHPQQQQQQQQQMLQQQHDANNQARLQFFLQSQQINPHQQQTQIHQPFLRSTAPAMMPLQQPPQPQHLVLEY